MDIRALFKISYGLYVVSANENGRTYLVTDVDTTASTVGFML